MTRGERQPNLEMARPRFAKRSVWRRLALSLPVGVDPQVQRFIREVAGTRIAAGGVTLVYQPTAMAAPRLPVRGDRHKAWGRADAPFVDRDDPSGGRPPAVGET